MEIRRDLLLGVGSLFVLNLLVALITIGALTRMSPVIERMLRENVASVQAGEDMLAALGGAGAQPLAAPERDRFTAALRRAQDNVTEPEEKEPLAALSALVGPLVDGAPGARPAAMEQIRRLMSVNYRVMEAANQEARRLSRAGAWFCVFSASLALLLSVVAVRRLTQRLIQPVRELWSTLEATRSGDLFRRCVVSDAPLEIARIVNRVNEMLELRANPRPWSDRRAQIDHALVLWSLRKYPEPTFILDEQGHIVAANPLGHALLAEPRGRAVREKLNSLGARSGSAELPSGLTLAVEDVPEAKVRVCRVRSDEAPRDGVRSSIQ